LPASAGDPVEAAGEVIGQAEEELLGRAHAQFLGLGEDRVLLCVGGDDVLSVAFGVRSLEVAPPLRGDVEIADLVTLRDAVDPHESVLRLAVLIRCPSDLAQLLAPIALRRAGARGAPRSPCPIDLRGPPDSGSGRLRRFVEDLILQGACFPWCL